MYRNKRIGTLFVSSVGNNLAATPLFFFLIKCTSFLRYRCIMHKTLHSEFPFSGCLDLHSTLHLKGNLEWFVHVKMLASCAELSPMLFSGSLFYRKSTIGTTIAAIEANNDTYCLQKRIEKFPLLLPFSPHVWFGL